jgi:hypothetical protein
MKERVLSPQNKNAKKDEMTQYTYDIGDWKTFKYVMPKTEL